MPGVEGADKTVKLPPYISAVLSFAVSGVEGADKTVFASHFFRGALAQLRIHLSLVARFEGAEETVIAAQPGSTVSNFAPYPTVFPLRSSRGRCRLRQMRCYYIRAAGATLLSYVSVLLILKSIVVGASIARPFIMVSSAAPDRADAITVSVSAQKRH